MKPWVGVALAGLLLPQGFSVAGCGTGAGADADADLPVEATETAEADAAESDADASPEFEGDGDAEGEDGAADDGAPETDVANEAEGEAGWEDVGDADVGLDPCDLGRCWYVDRDATGAANGRSWFDAWPTFAAIDWASVAPGDFILISGGTDGKTYLETLNVETRGEPGRPVTITGARDPGHDGVVMLDGELVRERGVSIRARRWVTLTRLSFRGFTGAAVHISGLSGTSYREDDAAAHVVAENLVIDADGGRGVFVQTSHDVTVRGCTITTPAWVDAQTDGIYS